MARKVGIDPANVLVTSCGCALHLQGLREDGYAVIKRGGKMEGAHRVAWRERNGEIPAGMMVCHSCDIRCCVADAHLFLGTAKNNAVDRQQKGRSAPPSTKFLQSRKGKSPTGRHRESIIAANKRRTRKPTCP